MKNRLYECMAYNHETSLGLSCIGFRIVYILSYPSHIFLSLYESMTQSGLAPIYNERKSAAAKDFYP